MEAHTCSLGGGREGPYEMTQKGDEVAGLGVERRGRHVQTREVEESIGQVTEPVDVRLHVLQPPLEGRRYRLSGLVESVVQRTVEKGEWRAKLVADIGKEALLFLI
jgi:hypothetical protein